MKNISKHIVYALMLSVICISFISTVSASPFLEYYSGSIDDDNSGISSGNSNGKINPEETIEITVKIENNGNTDVSGVTGELRLKKPNPPVTIIDDDASYGTIGSNERKEGTFVFHVSDVHENSIYESISLEIMLTDSSGNTWTDSFTKYVDFPSITATATSEPTNSDAPVPTLTKISDSGNSNLNPYFPLEVGRQWTYVWSNDMYHPEEIIEEFKITEKMGEQYTFSISNSVGSTGQFSCIEQKNVEGNLIASIQNCCTSGACICIHGDIIASTLLSYICTPSPLIQYPLEIGEQWSLEFRELAICRKSSSDDFTGTSYIAGFEDITVPSGTYLNCLTIKSVIVGPHNYVAGTCYMWFAKDVGLVKFAYYHEDGSSTVCQLKLESIETYDFPPSKYDIDGYSDDWSAIESIVTDKKGDGVSGVSGTDIKAVYTDSDENYLYLMMEFWDEPTNPHIDDYETTNGNRYGGYYSLRLITDDDENKDTHERGPQIALLPDPKGPDATSYSYDMIITNNADDPEYFLYDSSGYRLGIDKSQNVLYACEDVVEIQIPWDMIENPDFLQIRGSVKVAHAKNADSGDFGDHTDSGTYISLSLFQINDFKDLSGFIVKLENAQDPLSRYLKDQFSEETLFLLDEYSREGTPSEALQTALETELNEILQSGSLYDEKRFENIELSEDVLKLIEDNPQGQDMIELNRLLLEEAYPQEIEKSEYKVKKSKHVPGFLGFSLIISILFIWGRRKFT